MKVSSLAISLCIVATHCWFLVAARDLGAKDRACSVNRADGVIFGDYGGAIVNYLDGFSCPHPEPGDEDYFCRTRTSDNAISFNEADNFMTVDTTKWFGGGFRMGCMKKDFTTGWQCAATCGIGKNFPRFSDWGFLTFEARIYRTGNCLGRVKIMKNWRPLSSNSIELSGDYISAPDQDGWSRVIIPTHDFKTCEWTELDNVKDIIFENCPDGNEHPKYEIRDMKLTDFPEVFEDCHCLCEDGSHNVFTEQCINPTPPPPPPEPKTLFGEMCNLNGAADSLSEWKLSIPEEATHLYCKTWGGTGDVALFVSWDDFVNPWDWTNNTCAVNADGCNNQEECSGDQLKPYGDDLYVAVQGREAYSGVCLTCSYKMLLTCS